MLNTQPVPPPNSVVIGDEDLLVFIDETGHEDFLTKEKLFGLGGIVVYGAEYVRSVETAWARIRADIGLSPTDPLHAATDFAKYQGQLNAIASFFEAGPFIRHVSIVTPQTVSDFDPFITASCAGLARNIGRALANAYQRVPVNRVVYVVEHSERLHATYAKLVGPTGPTLIAADGTRVTFPHFWGALRKSSCTAGLEVADFVLHAAQGQVLARRRDSGCAIRKDFNAVFRSVPAHFVEYMEINDAQSSPDEGPPGTYRIGLQ